MAGAGQTVSGCRHGVRHALPWPGQHRRVAHDHHAGDDAAVVPRVWAGRRRSAACCQGHGQGGRDCPGDFYVSARVGPRRRCALGGGCLAEPTRGAGALDVAGRCAVPARAQSRLQLAVSGHGTDAARVAVSTALIGRGEPLVHPVFRERPGAWQRLVCAARGQRAGGRFRVVADVARAGLPLPKPRALGQGWCVVPRGKADLGVQLELFPAGQHGAADDLLFARQNRQRAVRFGATTCGCAANVPALLRHYHGAAACGVAAGRRDDVPAASASSGGRRGGGGTAVFRRSLADR